MSLTVETVSPIPSSSGLPLDTTILVTFDRLVNQGTVTAASFMVTKQVTVDVAHFMNQDSIAATTAVDGVLSFGTTANGTKTQVSFKPKTPLDPTCEFKVLLSKDILGQDGQALASIYSWKFSTGSGAIV